MEHKGMICLIRSKENIVDFLNEGRMNALLNVKHINDHYAATVKEAMHKVKETKEEMLRYEFLDEGRNSIINTPIKRHKVGTQRTPTSKKLRLKSPTKAK